MTSKVIPGTNSTKKSGGARRPRNLFQDYFWNDVSGMDGNAVPISIARHGGGTCAKRSWIRNRDIGSGGSA